MWYRCGKYCFFLYSFSFTSLLYWLQTTTIWLHLVLVSDELPAYHWTNWFQGTIKGFKWMCKYYLNKYNQSADVTPHCFSVKLCCKLPQMSCDGQYIRCRSGCSLPECSAFNLCCQPYINSHILTCVPVWEESAKAEVGVNFCTKCQRLSECTSSASPSTWLSSSCPRLLAFHRWVPLLFDVGSTYCCLQQVHS